MLKAALNCLISFWDAFLNCDTRFVVQVLFSLGIWLDASGPFGLSSRVPH